MLNRYFIRAALIVLMLMVLAPAVHARDAIVITSETLMADRNNNIAVFEGVVEAKSAEMVMNALKMIAHYGQEGEVVSIEAEGQVKFVRGLQVLTSDKAIYNMKDRVVTFSGSPRAVDKGKVLMGKSMKYLLDSGVIEVERSTVIINNDAAKGSANE